MSRARGRTGNRNPGLRLSARPKHNEHASTAPAARGVTRNGDVAARRSRSNRVGDSASRSDRRNFLRRDAPVPSGAAASAAPRSFTEAPPPNRPLAKPYGRRGVPTPSMPPCPAAHCSNQLEQRLSPRPDSFWRAKADSFWIAPQAFADRPTAAPIQCRSLHTYDAHTWSIALNLCVPGRLRL